MRMNFYPRGYNFLYDEYDKAAHPSLRRRGKL